MVKNKTQGFLILILFLLVFEVKIFPQVSSGRISGTVTEKLSGLPLPGVNVKIEGNPKGSITDATGNYIINDIEPATYNLVFSFISFESLTIKDVTVKDGTQTEVNASLSESSVMLNDVVIVADRKTDNEISVINTVKESVSIVNGISAQVISRSQDGSASEVIRKSSGISVINDKFIIVRGLSQRYNNVWLNNSPVPGTESDTRSFEFDLIPASQIDNLLIYKSPSPELPADFSGGFVKITTKSITDKNSLAISYGTGASQGTTFTKISLPESGIISYLGFDNGFRGLPVNFPSVLNNVSTAKSAAFTRVMDNDWTPRTSLVLPDQKLSVLFSRCYKGKRIPSADNFISFTYAMASKHFEIISRRYGIFDINTQRSSLYNNYYDVKESREIKLAILYNWTFKLSEKFRLDIRNLYNQFGNSSYTVRAGDETYSGEYDIRSFSDRYYSRSVYSGQVAGQFNNNAKSNSRLDWTIGYALSSRNEPDRRIVTSRRNRDFDETSSFGLFRTESNDIKRLFQKLTENNLSGSVDYKFTINPQLFITTINAGWYGEYRNRIFNARNFAYDTGNSLPSSFYNLPVNEMLSGSNISEDGIYIEEKSNKSDSYSADNILQAFYLSSALRPVRSLLINTGLRVEYNKLILGGYESDGIEKVDVINESIDLFPSLNAVLIFNDRNQVRIAYGKSVNRPEFREIAPYVYYDFDAFSYFEGNPEIHNSHVNNYEFRYEYYPQKDELITAGAFYKRFSSPIEMTYYETGGSLQYTYKNADLAITSGIELEIRKSLDFTGIKGFSAMFNGALVHSRVDFSKESIEKDRSMQGQSPYIINAGLFYAGPKDKFSASVTCNRIGKRIIAVGQVYQNDTESIPDIYEMPVTLLNFSASVRLGKKTELALSAKDILNEKSEYKQFVKFDAGELSVNQTNVTRSFRTGRYLGLSLGFKF